MKKVFLIFIILVLLIFVGTLVFSLNSEDWLEQKIDSAFLPSECKIVSGQKYGTSYYDGPLIDTHYHIPAIPDDKEFVSDNITPKLGSNIKITDIVCTLEQENTEKVFAFFPVYPDLSEPMLKVAEKTMLLYPDKFVPFIMPPDGDDKEDGSPTVNSETLKKMLDVYPGLFKGYGEIGLYGREDGAGELPPDSPKLQKIYPVIAENNLIVYFHLGLGQKDSFEIALEQNPEINFIWHGDQLISYENGGQNLEAVEDILYKHKNVFYTVDELYGDVWMLRPDKTKEQFLKHLENYEQLLEKDLDTWKSVIERHPDQFMWGTDRSDQVLWSHDPEIGQALSNYARAFISHLSPEVQEKFAYKNAEKLLSKAE